ncbi:MAG: ISAs1 family transposase [Candidatus Thiodiazotropha sp. 4PDIV1]
MSLFDHLNLIEDPRSHINLNHNLVDIIFLVLAATASGCNGWLDIEEFGNEHLAWLQQHRPFTKGIPTRHSIARIIKAIDVEMMVLALFRWTNSLRAAADKPLIAIDGKTLRGAVNQQGAEHSLHLVSAFDTEQGIVLYQEDTKTKGSEIATVRELLHMLDVQDAVLTFDALHCNKETLQQIIKRKGDYIVQVKGNQPNLRKAIEAQFQPHWEAEGTGLPMFEEEDKGHGREERRTTFQIPAMLPKEIAKHWPSAKSVIAVERKRTSQGKTTFDTHYYLSSLAVDVALAARAVRQHWHIENQQHWVLDVTFKEDASRIGDRENAKKMALFRRIVFNLLQQHPLKASKPSKIRKAAWNGDFRSELFFG